MRDREEKRRNLIMKIMAGIIIVLVLFIVFLFIIQPQVVKYNNNKMIQGVDYAIGTILSSIQSQGYFEIPLGENQTLILVPWVPEEQAQPTQG